MILEHAKTQAFPGPKAESNTWCRVSAQILMGLGGWNKKSSLHNYYITGPDPKEACAAAGHRSMNDYRPADKYAEPSAKLINLVFGVVLIVTDQVTGEEVHLNVDEAIAYCQRHDENSSGKQASAAPFFQVLRLFAKTLLQVSMLES